MTIAAQTFDAILPGNAEIVAAKKVNGISFAGGDRAPEGTAIKLDGGVYELRGAVLKFQDTDW